MKRPKIFAHGSYIGNTGYNHHTRDFFRHLSEHCDIKVRNYTIGSSWDGMSKRPHDGEPYFNQIDEKILYEQILWSNDSNRINEKMYESPEKEFTSDLNIVLAETNHHIYYDGYKGPKIAYNVWESTLQPYDFFNKLKDYDEVWVPSKWQKDCLIKQGYDETLISVVPEGVDVHTFFPEKIEKLNDYHDGRFKFLVFGRWEYRKSTKEIIETFLKTFDKSDPVDLIVSIDNPFGKRIDNLETTEDRLKYYGINDDRIKIIHFPSRQDYVKYLKTGHVFISCSRSEGWNLPLLEAMACGTPSIYSECSGQLEFAKGRGVPIKIVKETPANLNTYVKNQNSNFPGNYYEPDFDHLSEMMRKVYENYDSFKKQALIESEDIRKEFSWENVAKIGIRTIDRFLDKKPWLNKKIEPNKINISYIDGPRVEILGKNQEEYEIEFIDGKNVVRHTSKISNNMWTKCSIKYYIPWKIKINGQIVEELDLNDQEVMICLESKALGDTIAWAPYAVKFSEKHNCKVILSTFHNYLFENLEAYRNIKFIKPGQSHTCKSIYRIGWFKKDGKWNDLEKNPNQVNIIPLQKTATDILGLDFEELNYGLDFKKGKNPMKKPYVVFGPNATAGCKEWTFENWVSLANMIKKKGYDVVTLSKNPYNVKEAINVSNMPLDVVANYLYHAKAFIGLGSGLSWFNWALGNHTYMINGMARPNHEFTSRLTKIYNENVCIYCWNDEVFVFDPGDWDWCPVYKGTSKQHICQKSITPEQVFELIAL